MVLGYTPHAAPMQMSFYTGAQFPDSYRGDAFVSFHGSWNRKPSSGYEVVRIRFKNGQPTGFEPFLTGFLTPQGEIGRPFGNAVARDGSLLVGDDRAGVIYRVSYVGDVKGSGNGHPSTLPATTTSAANASSPPAKEMLAEAAKGSEVPLAIQRPETSCGAAHLLVTSTAFKNGAAIPATYSAYEQDNSFPLTWTGSPRRPGAML